MAPRLSRWIVLTIIAAGVVATSLLTTGGDPLLFFARGGMWQEAPELAPAARRITAVRYALLKVRAQRALLEEKEQVAAALARTDADPIVLKREGARLVIDAPSTAALGPLWSVLSARRSDVRSIILQKGSNESNGWWNGLAPELRPDGTCYIRTRIVVPPEDLLEDIRTSGAECLFAEQFGVPGKGVRQWLVGVRAGLSWDRVQRNYWNRRETDQVVRAAGAWFEGEGEPSFWRSEYVWSQVTRSETACVGGRVEACEAAAGVGEEGWPLAEERRWGLYNSQFPNGRMPRDLMHAVGPEKFAEIWSSDQSIAASYARVTGAPMEGWLMQWGRRFTGTVIRDNALSLVGWLGALIWMTLLSVLTAQRLKQRAVT